MTPGAPCPNCGGIITRHTDSTWLRCPGCCRSYDGHGLVYDRDWRTPERGAT